MISAAMHRDRASMINGYEQGEVRVILLYGARAARFRARAAVEQLAFERGRQFERGTRREATTPICSYACGMDGKAHHI